jgi:hypothetical protein
MTFLFLSIQRSSYGYVRVRGLWGWGQSGSCGQLARSRGRREVHWGKAKIDYKTLYHPRRSRALYSGDNSYIVEKYECKSEAIRV